MILHSKTIKASSYECGQRNHWDYTIGKEDLGALAIQVVKFIAEFKKNFAEFLRDLH